MTKTISYSVVGFVLIAVFSCAPPETTVERYDLVVQGGRVMDPESGLDAVRNLGIRDGRIEEISANTLVGERIVDATGLVVAPGFYRFARAWPVRGSIPSNGSGWCHDRV